MWGDGYGIGWMWIFGALIFVEILVIGVLVIVYLVRAAGRSRDEPIAPSTPRRVLDERYARGELTSDEYRERVQTLRSTE